MSSPSSLFPPSALSPSLPLPSFTVLLKLTSGSYGSVYSCLHKPTSSKCCLKRYKKSVMGDIKRGGVNQCAVRELEALNKIRDCSCGSHADNVVKYYGTASSRHDIYFIFEMLPVDLDVVMKRNVTLPIAVSTTVLMGICSGISFVNDVGYMHRDVKPSNLMYDNVMGNVKLADFGMAREICRDRYRGEDDAGEGDGAVYTGNVVSLWYRPPEVLFLPCSSSSCGGQAKYDETIDVWSAAIVFLHMVLGRDVLAGGTVEGQRGEISRRLGRVEGERDVGGSVGSCRNEIGELLEVTELPMYSRGLRFSREPLRSVPPALSDLLVSMLSLEPGERCTAGDAKRNDRAWLGRERDMPRFNEEGRKVRKRPLSASS